MMEGGGASTGDRFVRADQIDLKNLDEHLERHLSRVLTLEKKEGRVRQREDWEIDTAKLVIKGLIARGSFGTVHRGVYDSHDVAVESKALQVAEGTNNFLQPSHHRLDQASFAGQRPRRGHRPRAPPRRAQRVQPRVCLPFVRWRSQPQRIETFNSRRWDWEDSEKMIDADARVDSGVAVGGAAYWRTEDGMVVSYVVTTDQVVVTVKPEGAVRWDDRGFKSLSNFLGLPMSMIY